MSELVRGDASGLIDGSLLAFVMVVGIYLITLAVS
jgi:hypothetical protein